LAVLEKKEVWDEQAAGGDLSLNVYEEDNPNNMTLLR